MSLNDTQKSILSISNNISLELEKEFLVQSFIKLLEMRMEQELVKDKTSNIYVLTEVFVDKVIEYKLEFLSLITKLEEFFNTHKYSGYASGNYTGLRSSLLDLNIFKDCKIELVKPGLINIIVLPNDNVNLQEKKKDILEKIHKYISIGIKTYENKEEVGLNMGKINASNGQELEYGYYVAKVRKFNIKVTYYLDYEVEHMLYDIAEAVKEKILHIYNKKYMKIGKDIKVQDFYSMVIEIAGLGRISVELIEINDKGEVIKRYQDEDIKIGIKEIFTINSIEVIGGANT